MPAAMAEELCGLKAQLQEKEKEIAALRKKLAQLEKVRKTYWMTNLCLLLEIKFVSGPILEKNSPHVLSYTM